MSCRLKAITLALNSRPFLTLCTFNRQPCKYERSILSARNIGHRLAPILQYTNQHSGTQSPWRALLPIKRPIFNSRRLLIVQTGGLSHGSRPRLAHSILSEHKVFSGISELLKIRRQQSAFHPMLPCDGLLQSVDMEPYHTLWITNQVNG